MDQEKNLPWYKVFSDEKTRIRAILVSVGLVCIALSLLTYLLFDEPWKTIFLSILSSALGACIIGFVVDARKINVFVSEAAADYMWKTLVLSDKDKGLNILSDDHKDKLRKRVTTALLKIKRDKSTNDLVDLSFQELDDSLLGVHIDKESIDRTMEWQEDKEVWSMKEYKETVYSNTHNQAHCQNIGWVLGSELLAENIDSNKWQLELRGRYEEIRAQDGTLILEEESFDDSPLIAKSGGNERYWNDYAKFKINIPARSTVSVVLVREIFLPKNDVTVIGWNKPRKSTSFTCRFSGKSVDILGKINNCARCEGVDHCTRCPVLSRNGQPVASVTRMSSSSIKVEIRDWIGRNGKFSVSWRIK